MLVFYTIRETGWLFAQMPIYGPCDVERMSGAGCYNYVYTRDSGSLSVIRTNKNNFCAVLLAFWLVYFEMLENPSEELARTNENSTGMVTDPTRLMLAFDI